MSGDGEETESSGQGKLLCPNPVRPGDIDRAEIMKRRTLLIASAMASLAMVQCEGRPQPCLSVIPIPSPPTAVPTASLDVVPPTSGSPIPAQSATASDAPPVTVDAGRPPQRDAGIPDGGPAPQPCLSPRIRP